MKTMTTRLVLMAGALFLGANGAAAQTVVTPTADGDLRVVDYSGKPPYKRSIIRAEDSADFARFETLQETVLVATSTSRRMGPLGKSLPRQRASLERVLESQIAQFARFEESDSPASTRRWRGAPGKGLPRFGR
ncbi:MAG: hypothetical protein ACO3R5_12540 [Pseudohongiellaceae bacterium]|jgi:hypothetical protein